MEYSGPFNFINGELYEVRHAYGELRKIDEDFEAIYKIYDHGSTSLTMYLGSTRVVFWDEDGDGEISSDEVLERIDAHPSAIAVHSLKSPPDLWFCFATGSTKLQCVNPFGLEHHRPIDAPEDMETHYRYTGQEHGPDGLPYYDYIARQYDPALGRFLGMDELAREFPSWSPYNYVYNNPLRFVDPDGRAPDDHEYSIDKNGRIQKVEHVKGSTFDRLHTKENWESGNLNNSITVNDQGILASLEKNHEKLKVETMWGELQGTYVNTTNRVDAFKVFKFASDNSNVEWGLIGSKSGMNTLGTLYENAVVGGLLNVSGFGLNELSFDYHSHPGGSGVGDTASGMLGDQGHASLQVSKLLKSGVSYDNLPRYYIYRPHVEKPYRFEYSPWKNKFNVNRVFSWKNL